MAKNLKGSLLIIRHLPDGTFYQIKGNNLDSLALGSDDTYGWATLTGKGTYAAPNLEPIGNHEFVLYIEDRNEPGNGVDMIWLQVLDQQDDVIVDMSMDEPAEVNRVEIEEGNIVVPH